MSDECAAALAIALMIPEHMDCLLKLPRPSVPASEFSSLEFVRKKCGQYSFLPYDMLDRSITLSCIPQGIDSILSSIFFDPSIPCNLAGAHLTGILQALEILRVDSELVVLLMMKEAPRFAPLWLAALWCGRTSRVLSNATGGLPPIHLAVASWLQNLQTFAQVQYAATKGQNEVISRAQEYTLSYLTKTGNSLPVSPWPPFGTTMIKNVDLEIREHLAHEHRPLRHQTYWLLEHGQRQRTSDVSGDMPLWSTSVLKIGRPGPLEAMIPNADLEEADNISNDATFNLFNWQKNNEGGLWLAAKGATDEQVRRIHGHAWIHDDSDESINEGSALDTLSDMGVDRPDIEPWLDLLPHGEEGSHA